MTRLGYAIVFVVSAAILAYEIFLMGLFALIQWHHFASMIISVALLGFGVSGTVLALWRTWFATRWQASFHISALLFFVSLFAVSWVLPQVPFNPFRLMWDARQLLPLLAYYVLLLVPFAAGATVIGIAFIHPRAHISRVYSVNLLGSGLGVFGGLLLGFLPLHVPLSEYKSLSKTLRLPDASVTKSTAHPLGRVDVASAPAQRVAPGLSLAYHGPMPKQEAIYVNGDGPSALLLGAPHDTEMEFLEWLPTALPYELLARPRVLIIGSGGGLDVLQAMRLNAASVTALESHPRVVDHVSQRLAVGADIRVAEARGFTRATRQQFDLIQISLLESFGTASAGIHSLQENYLYTVEAFANYLARLDDDGLLAITRWLKTPPRDEIRLFATAVQALEAMGSPTPAEQLLFVRGLQTGTLLVRKTPFHATDIEKVRRFCEKRWFDLDHFPGIREEDANRFNRAADNVYFESFQMILFGDRTGFFRDHLFDVHPTTDDRPFFFQFLQWQHAAELWKLLRRQALPLVEWGYVVLLATIVQTVVVSIILIGLPLILSKHGGRSVEGKWAVLMYFAALGTGFMLIEMAMLQKFVLYLAHPIYSAAVVIATFLVVAGIGSSAMTFRSPLIPLCMIVVVGVFELLALPRLFNHTLAAGTGAKVFLVIASTAPLAFFMGMPFPILLRRLSENAPSLVPWAWGVNGCFSVVAASLAPLLAIHLGFTLVIVLGLGCYLVATLLCERGALSLRPLRG